MRWEECWIRIYQSNPFMEKLTGYTIRKAVVEDGEELIELVKALLAHLGDSIDNFDDHRFLNDAFGTEPQFSVLVVVASEGALMGYALFHDSYEPAYAARGVYLVDFFLRKEARGKGLGKRLLGAVAWDAQERGRTFLWLLSPDEEARAFYDHAMSVKVDLVAYALTANDFETLADIAKR